MAAVGEFGSSIDTSERRAVRSVRSGYTRMYSGDVVLAKITPCMENGKLAIVPDVPHGRAAGTTEFHVFEPQRVSAQFLYYWLNRQAFRQDAERNMTGTAGQKRVPADWLRNYPIPIPPPNIQDGITSRVKELFAEIEEGERALTDARAGLDTYRKSLLNAAITGQLTTEWRAKNSHSDTGAKFLSRISHVGRIANQPVLQYAPTDQSSCAPFELPPEWCWTTFGDVIESIKAGLNVKAEGRPPEHGERGIVKVSAVTWDEYDEGESKTLPASVLPPDDEVIRVGDFLISRANTLELVGAPVIVRSTSKKMYLSDKVLRLEMPDAIKEWVYFYLKSPRGRNEIEERSTGNQLSMRNISQNSLRSIPVPIPPETEMTYLLGALRSGWGFSRTYASRGGLGADTCSLRQSILSAAFRGELL